MAWLLQCLIILGGVSASWEIASPPSQSLFQPAAITLSPFANAPYGVATADMDGDGDIDVLSASGNDDLIAWYENVDGAGFIWAPHAIARNADGAREVQVADIDDDGDLDVLSASMTDNKVAWYENVDGAGALWKPHIISRHAYGAHSVYAADMDGDGHLDVLSASDSDGVVAWYRNVGGKGYSWTTHIMTQDGGQAQSVIAIDLDGDGDMDAIRANHAGNGIAWLENQDGVGLNWTFHLISATSTTANSVRAGDVDGDGDIDVLFASTYGNLVAWYENDGNASSWIRHTIATTGVTGVRTIHIMDMDQDGDIDVLTEAPSGGTFRLYENQQNGSVWALHVMGTANRPSHIVAADINGDGYMDAVGGASTGNSILWFQQDPGALGTWQTHTITKQLNAVSEIYAADVNSDGLLDILSASWQDDTIAWFENAGGIDGLGTIHTIATDCDGARSVKAADVDGDGDLDVLSAAENSGSIAWYENINGTGYEWVTHTIATGVDGATFVYAEDIDGDGDIDVLSASELQSRIAWYENANGLGTSWIPRQISSDVPAVRAVRAADIDNDGSADVLGIAGNGVAWFHNVDGTGKTWAKTVVSTECVNGRALDALDFDGDGDIDILSACRTDHRVSWHENVDGRGEYWLTHFIATAAGAHAVYAADLDGDGDFDVVSAAKDSNTIAWHENNDGNGHTWRTFNMWTTMEEAYSVTAVDVDGDGDLDVLGAAWNGNEIDLFVNQYAGESLREGFNIATNAAGGRSVHTADIDGDGYMDVLSAAFYRPTIVWYRNADGEGGNWSEHVIIEVVATGHSVYAVDIDGDGDTDVLSAATPGGYSQNVVLFSRNMNGTGEVWDTKVISTTASDVRSVYGADIDGDGDVDVLSASGDNKVILYENLDGEGASWEERVVSSAAGDPFYVRIADIDSDGDFDILSASRGDNKIVWYENVGNTTGPWLSHSISTSTPKALSIVAGDFNGDGLIDVLSASFDSNTVAWHENVDSGSSWVEHYICTNSDGVHEAVAADLDGDGDLDVVVADSTGNTVSWHENMDGAGVLWNQHILTRSAKKARAVDVVDIDGDGDLDIVSSSWEDARVTLWESRLADAPTYISQDQPVAVTTSLSSVRTSIASANRDHQSAVICNTPGKACIEVLSQKVPLRIDNVAFRGIANPLLHVDGFASISLRRVSFEVPAGSAASLLHVLAGAALLLESAVLHDSECLGPCVQFVDVADVTLYNLTASRCQSAAGSTIKFVDVPQARVTKSLFQACEAEFGGAVGYHITPGYEGIEPPTLLIDFTDFIGNRAERDGGAIFVDDRKGHMSFNVTDPPLAAIRNCSFHNNVASNGAGGAVAFRSRESFYVPSDPFLHGYATLPRLCRFEDVEMEGNRGVVGGAIHGINAYIQLTNCTLERNLASAWGAGVGLYFSSLVAESTKFLGNTAAYDKAVESSGVLDDFLLLDEANFHFQKAGSGGAVAAMHCIAGGSVFSSSVFERNQASGSGGAVYLFDCSSTVTDSVMEWNVAGAHGGGLAASNSELVVTGTTFARNNGTDCGGGIASESQYLQVTDCIVAGNGATHGGGLCVLRSNASSTVLRSTFSTNQGAIAGGAIFMNDSRLLGGSINAISNVAWDVESSPDSKSLGGGFAAVVGDSLMELRSSTITQSRGRNGGNVFLGCGSSLLPAPGTSGNSVQWGSANTEAGNMVYMQCNSTNALKPWSFPVNSLASSATSAIIVSQTAGVVELLDAPDPILELQLKDFLFRNASEDSTTTCSIAVATNNSMPGTGSDVILLHPPNYKAVNGRVEILPFAFFAPGAKALAINITCTAFSQFHASTSLPVTIPSVRWSSAIPSDEFGRKRGVVYPSSDNILIPIDPCPTIEFFVDNGVINGFDDAQCSISATYLNGIQVRLVGSTSSRPTEGSTPFCNFGVESAFNTTILLEASCQLRTGTVVHPPEPMYLLVPSLLVDWIPSSVITDVANDTHLSFVPSTTAWQTPLREGEVQLTLMSNIPAGNLPPIADPIPITCEIQNPANQLFTLLGAISVSSSLNVSGALNTTAIWVVRFPPFSLAASQQLSTQLQQAHQTYVTAKCTWNGIAMASSTPLHLWSVPLKPEWTAPPSLLTVYGSPLNATVALSWSYLFWNGSSPQLSAACTLSAVAPHAESAVVQVRGPSVLSAWRQSDLEAQFDARIQLLPTPNTITQVAFQAQCNVNEVYSISVRDDPLPVALAIPELRIFKSLPEFVLPSSPDAATLYSVVVGIDGWGVEGDCDLRPQSSDIRILQGAHSSLKAINESRSEAEFLYVSLAGALGSTGALRAACTLNQGGPSIQVDLDVTFGAPMPQWEDTQLITALYNVPLDQPMVLFWPQLVDHALMGGTSFVIKCQLVGSDATSGEPVQMLGSGRLGVWNGTMFEHTFSGQVSLKPDDPLASDFRIEASCTLNEQYTIRSEAIDVHFPQLALRWHETLPPVILPSGPQFTVPYRTAVILDAPAIVSGACTMVPEDVTVTLYGSLSATLEVQNISDTSVAHIAVFPALGVGGSIDSNAAIAAHCSLDSGGSSIIIKGGARLYAFDSEWSAVAERQSPIPPLVTLYSTQLPRALWLTWPDFASLVSSSSLSGESIDYTSLMVTCTLRATSGDGERVAIEGIGRQSEWDGRHFAAYFNQDIRLQPTNIRAREVTLSASCVMGKIYYFETPTLTVALAELHIEEHSLSRLPPVVLPSSRQNQLPFTFAIRVMPSTWQLNGSCVIEPDDSEDATSIALFGSVQAKLQPAQAVFDDSAGSIALFTSVGLEAPFGSFPSVRVTCSPASGGPSMSLELATSVINYGVLLEGPTVAHRLQEITLTAWLNLLGDIEDDSGFNSTEADWFPPTMECTLVALNSSSALTSSGGILTGKPQVVEDGSGSFEHDATVDFIAYLDAKPGDVIPLQVVCSVSSQQTKSNVIPVRLVAFTGEVIPNTTVTEWLPSSSTFLVPLDPSPTIQLFSDGVPLDSTATTNCEATVINRATSGSATLLSAPELGYYGKEGRSTVVLDRIIISAPLGATVGLRIVCKRGVEEVALPELQIYMVHPKPFYIQRPPTLIVTQRPFSIMLGLSPNTSLVRARAEVECDIAVGNAIAQSGVSTTSQDGIIHFDSVSLTGLIGREYSGTINCDMGVPLKSPLNFTVQVELCPPGTEPDESSSQCRGCPRNAYSDGGLQKCIQCPSTGVECYDGLLRLQTGYYPAVTHRVQFQESDFGLSNRTSNILLDESLVFYPCWNEEACEINSTSRVYGCSKGYKGPLCGVCDTEAGYVQSGEYCVACWPGSLNALVLGLAVVALIGGLTYIAVFQRFKRASAGKVIFRITLTYVQMLSSLGMFAAHATRTFRMIFGVSDVVGASFVSAPPFQCVLRLPFYTQFALNLSLPFTMVPIAIILATVVLLMQACCCRKRMSGMLKSSSVHKWGINAQKKTASEGSAIQSFFTSWKRYMKEKRFMSSAVFVLFLSYNTISTNAARMFQCRPEVIDDTRYHSADLSVTCYDSTHVVGMVIAAAMALLFNVGFPLLLLRFLRRHASELTDRLMLKRFGFLYQGYSLQRKIYGWESIVLLRKFVIVMVATTLEDPWYQTVAGISIIVLALLLQVHYKPYDNSLFNRLEVQVLVVLVFTQVLSLVYLRSQSLELSDAAHTAYDITITSALLLLNGGMFLILAYSFYKHSTIRHTLRGMLCRRCCPPPSNIARKPVKSPDDDDDDDEYVLDGTLPDKSGGVRSTSSPTDLGWRANPLMMNNLNGGTSSSFEGKEKPGSGEAMNGTWQQNPLGKTVMQRRLSLLSPSAAWKANVNPALKAFGAPRAGNNHAGGRIPRRASMVGPVTISPSQSLTGDDWRSNPMQSSKDEPSKAPPLQLNTTSGSGVQPSTSAQQDNIDASSHFTRTLFNGGKGRIPRRASIAGRVMFSPSQSRLLQEAWRSNPMQDPKDRLSSNSRVPYETVMASYISQTPSASASLMTARATGEDGRAKGRIPRRASIAGPVTFSPSQSRLLQEAWRFNPMQSTKEKPLTNRSSFQLDTIRENGLSPPASSPALKVATDAPSPRTHTNSNSRGRIPRRASIAGRVMFSPSQTRLLQEAWRSNPMQDPKDRLSSNSRVPYETVMASYISQTPSASASLMTARAIEDGKAREILRRASMAGRMTFSASQSRLLQESQRSNSNLTPK